MPALLTSSSYDKKKNQHASNHGRLYFILQKQLDFKVQLASGLSRINRKMHYPDWLMLFQLQANKM